MERQGVIPGLEHRDPRQPGRVVCDVDPRLIPPGPEEVRAAILAALREQGAPMTQGAIAAIAGLAPPRCAEQLQALHHAGLVAYDGKSQTWRLV